MHYKYKKNIVDRTGIKGYVNNIVKRGRDFRYWLYRLKWNYYPKFRILSNVPLHVDIEVSDACNLRCIMCVHGIKGVPNAGFIEPTLAYKAIDECAELGVYSIKFNFRGEPMLHKNLVEFVRYAKNKGVLEVQFNTNGLPANRKKVEDLVDAGLDRIIFSVDGATKESYEKIRVGGDYDKLIRNIETFIKVKKQKGVKRPFIRVQMVNYYETEREVEQFINFWKGRGVDNIAIIENQDRYVEDGYPFRDGKRPIGRRFCEQPWQRLNINRDGKVLMCCGDWNRKTVVGDYYKQSIEEIWHGATLNRLRDKIRKIELDDIPACRTCFRPTTYRWK